MKARKADRITSDQYLANLREEIFREPPDGAFTVQQAAGDGCTVAQRSRVFRRLKDDVRNGVLKMGQFRANGVVANYYWPAEG